MKQTEKKLGTLEKATVEKLMLSGNKKQLSIEETKARINKLERRNIELSTTEQLHLKIKMILKHLYPEKTEPEALAEHRHIIINSEEVSQ